MLTDLIMSGLVYPMIPYIPPIPAYSKLMVTVLPALVAVTGGTADAKVVMDVDKISNTTVRNAKSLL